MNDKTASDFIEYEFKHLFDYFTFKDGTGRTRGDRRINSCAVACILAGAGLHED